jgi:hypothetical protein
VDHVAPVQLALRLLITSGSRLLELEDVRSVVGPFDSKALVYPWKHPDPEMDVLAERVFRLAQQESRANSFAAIWRLVRDRPLPEDFHRTPGAAIPYLDEPWYCCAEPTPAQLARL